MSTTTHETSAVRHAVSSMLEGALSADELVEDGARPDDVERAIDIIEAHPFARRSTDIAGL